MSSADASAAPSERLRKWLHLAPGVLALAVRDLGYAGSIALAAALVLFNLWLLPRLFGSELWRPGEWAVGIGGGILLYPVSLLVVAVATPGRPEVLAGAWGLLAFGDAAATLIGRRWGGRSLPWNRSKSWVGLVAFVVVSWPVLWLLVCWSDPLLEPSGGLAAGFLAVAVVAAVLESLPWRMDDNVSVTVLGAVALYLVLMALDGPAEGAFASSLTVGLAIAIGLGAVGAAISGALSLGGAALGAVVAAGIAAGTGWVGFGLLLTFVVTGTVATRWRRARKGRAGAATAPSTRGVRNVIANGVVAAACGVVAAAGRGSWGTLACVAALAAATADTLGGEVGRVVAGVTRRLPDGARVEPGTDGGVSIAGSLVTCLAALAIAALAVSGGLLRPGQGVVVAVAGIAGAWLDSLLGGTLERHGALDNEGVNLLSTLAAAWLAAILAAAIG